MTSNKKIRLALHTQILLALLIGAIFGAFFAVSDSEINITFTNTDSKNETVFVKGWDKIIFQGEQNKEFASDEQRKIIRYAKSIKGDYSVTVLYANEEKQEFRQVASIEKVGTIATHIKPLGDLFIRLLCFIAIPLVLSTLIVGAASLGDIRKLGRVGSRTMAIYITTTTLAITIGLVATNLIRPGDKIPPAEKQALIEEYQANAAEKENASEAVNIDLIDFVVEIVPKNPFQAIADGKMLQLIFFAVMIGISLTFIDPLKAQPVVAFFEGFGEVMIKMVDFIMKLAPLGVFALIASTVAAFGYGIIMPLFWYMLVVVLGLFVQTVFVYSLMLKGLGRVSVLEFFKKIREAQVIGFSTSSSAATLPITMKCAENMGVRKDIASFVLPLGATINMDGTALYQGVAAVFIAQVYGIDLSLSQQLTVIFTAVLASIGTAPVPGLGIIMLVMILQAIGIPAEGIALILGVDRILDMLRTVTNITGDTAVAVTVGNMENRRANKKGK